MKAIKNYFLRILYYLRVWIFIIKKSLSKSMAFRFEFASKLIRMILMVGIQILLVKSLYSGSQNIMNWSVDQYYLLLGTFNFINYLGWGIFNINLWRLEEKILKGEFDFLLLQPTGSIFSSAFNEFFLDDSLGSLSGIVLVGYYFYINFSNMTPLMILGYITSLFIGFIIWFNIHLFFSAVNFIAVKNGLMDLVKNLTRIGSFPIDIFSQNIRFALYSIFPIAFIAVVPSRILSGIIDVKYIILGIFVALITTFLTRRFWHSCIRSYTGSGG